MIWFACKKCGKTHGRPETSVGTMIFCDCGHGNTVPWESTAPEPPPAVDLPAAPVLKPIAFDPPTSPAPVAPSTYRRPPDLTDEELPSRRRRGEKRDPDFCFNHQRAPRTDACADCKEAFCATCLVQFQGATLCGPCKNFRARRLELPAPNSAVASSSLIVSLAFGALMMCLLPWSQRGQTIPMIVVLIPQAVALGLGVWALRGALKDGRVGGQSLAITGVAASALTGTLAVLLYLSAAWGWV